MFSFAGRGPTLLLLTAAIASQSTSNAFVPISTTKQQPTMPTELFAESSRREALFGIMATFGAAAVGIPEKAEARYSSYAHREQDWQERKDKGEITYKTAKDLRAELREIAPMNSASSKIFCPNGPSAAVSPLMENKCGDRMAIPSVYGRTQDVVGNSVPGFAPGYTTNLSNAGGFPSYK